MPKPIDLSYPDPRSLTVEREFDAPADLVFACHSHPKLVQRWMLGPPGWSMPVCEISTEIGSIYR